MSGPLILAFDTAAAHCTAAVTSGDATLAKRHEPMAKGQAERLFGVIDEVLDTAGIDMGDLSAIGVGVGPGNFTGIRISVSAARGLALSLGVPAVGVSALEALAFGTDGPVLAAIDARRDQVYLQLFEHGRAQGPILADMAAIPADLARDDLTCIGAAAPRLADRLGGRAAPAAFELAPAIGHLARTRFAARPPRPAPLYIRPADAAPPREAPPKILP